jgi:hypothetical protein
MDKSIENLLIKKCGIDTQSLIKICSAVEKLKKSRVIKTISEVPTKTYNNSTGQYPIKPINKRTQALMTASV